MSFIHISYIHKDNEQRERRVGAQPHKKETVNTATKGDVVITGTRGEQYVVKPRKFLELYNVIDGVATPRPSPRLVARVSKAALETAAGGTSISFKAPWGEDMLLRAGDYLVKDGTSGYYRIEARAFRDTYTWRKST